MDKESARKEMELVLNKIYPGKVQYYHDFNVEKDELIRLISEQLWIYWWGNTNTFEASIASYIAVAVGDEEPEFCGRGKTAFDAVNNLIKDTIKFHEDSIQELTELNSRLWLTGPKGE